VPSHETNQPRLSEMQGEEIPRKKRPRAQIGNDGAKTKVFA